MTNLHPDKKDKWKGMTLKERWQDPEWCEFMAQRVRAGNAKRRGAKRSESTKAKIRASVQAYWDENPDDARRVDPEVKAKMGKGHPAKMQKPKLSSEELTKVRSETAKQHWQDPEYRANRAKKVRQMWKDPEYRAKQAASRVKANEIRRIKSKAMWKDPELRAKALAGINKAWDNEERKELIAEQRRADWSDAEYAKRMARLLREVNKGKVLTKEHRASISAGITKAILNGTFNPSNGPYKSGYYHSSKMNADLYCRSSYELAAYKMLDDDPFVAIFIPEPCAIPYKDQDGILHSYIPDLYVEYLSGYWQLIEIKPETRLMEEDNQLKMEAAAATYSHHFDIWTEQQLR